MFNGGTICVDHASGKIFIYYQQSLSVANSIKSMLRLKREAAEIGVRIEALHTDNGTFSSTEFMSHLVTKKQPVRTLLICASLRSPSGTITANRWPMAMDYVAWVYNHMPAKENDLSPNDIWSRSKDPGLKDTL
eukprot:326219-Ditylum_brightwellii.AAC.1